MLKEATPNLEKSLLLRPFPQQAPAGIDLASFRTRYRDAMIQQAGIAVFICGLKESGGGGGAPVTSDGVIEEFESAQRHGRVVIPIGATGGAAAEIWNRLDGAGNLPSGLTGRDFNHLNDPGQSASALAKIVGKAITAIDKAAPRRPKPGATA